MKLSDLLFGIEVSCGDGILPDTDIRGIASDSRRVENGYLFVCLRGTKSDGHDHIGEAVARGAILALVDEGWHSECNIPFIRAANTRSVLAKLWNNFCGRPSDKLDIVAVTGTNGKTSTTFLLREIFSCAGYKTGLIGTVSCFVGDRDITSLKSDESHSLLSNMTTPDPESLYQILSVMASEGVQIVFMEATSHALELCKLDALYFKLGLCTNITPEHLDFHGTMEGYFNAKSKLFSMCEKGIINADDNLSKRLVETAKCPMYTFSAVSDDADFFADEYLSRGALGIEYLFNSKKSVFRIKSPIPGKFNLQNTLLAVSAARMLDIHPTLIQDSLKCFFGVPGRMERVSDENECISVFVDYAHTPDALEGLLSSVCDFCKNGERITLVFGCGGNRDDTKRQTMGSIASKYADRVIVTSDNSRDEDSVNIIFDILRGIDRSKSYMAISDRRDAIEYAIMSAEKNEVIILAGKGHETYQIKGDKRIEFDEKEIVRGAIQKYHR